MVVVFPDPEGPKKPKISPGWTVKLTWSNEIDFIESVNGVSQLNVSGEQFTSSQTMSELEQQLTTLGFFRCHRSYLVNLQQIAELISYSRNSYTLILKNKSKLLLSRGKLTDLKALINF